MTPNTDERAIVVGVRSANHEQVVDVAASLAVDLRVGLVCVWVDPVQVSLGVREDGTEISAYIDPDVDIEAPPEFPPDLLAQMRAVAERRGIAPRMRAVAGPADRAIAALADRVDAPMIVVGSREAGVGRAVREFFNGSVAARLTHRQHRPVLVVPLHPTGFDQPLPWQTE